MDLKDHSSNAVFLDLLLLLFLSCVSDTPVCCLAPTSKKLIPNQYMVSR